MPLYEYECKKCGQTFEVIEKFSDEPLKKHAGCGGKVERLLSAPGLQFKGSGWYITDYARSGGGGAAEKGESKSESKSETSAASSETKSADKPAKAAKKKK